ncbi:hypothetical protein HMPREF1624_06337 [Sporothrix schenckii ATCC 58251]|uniref:Uncharacterized protein n=1 Tax=Sporothrix schenckii (strain ATCC 58251 / de Perez 2211183) TaxID=1391915 RepID=U7PRB8_SPOS1|nr:hypothetical protein HMPREF1624_06337 [Sporothrix schenckii ATCC 58251]
MRKRDRSATLLDSVQKKHRKSGEPDDETRTPAPVASQDAEHDGDDGEDGEDGEDGAGGEDGQDRDDAEGSPFSARGDERPLVVNPPPRSAYKIPAYTHENRTMRLYAGPLRKWDRRQALVNTVYGPRADNIRLFWDLQIRWQRCMYPKPLRQDDVEPGNTRGVVLVSPWLPNNLESDQQTAYGSWWNKYAAAMRAQSRAPFGEVDEIGETEATPFLPWYVSTESDLDIFDDSSNSILCLRAGESSTYRTTSDAGAGARSTGSNAPTETNREGQVPVDKPPSPVFYFNPGGKVLSLAWAPMPKAGRMEGSLLAVAVVPHKHDDDKNTVDGLSGATTKEERARFSESPASIQFWRVALRGGKSGEPSVFGDGARLDWVSCFYWGWPKRLEWCPVQPLMGDSWPGLLAVLTEDGIVRIIKARGGMKEQTRYGKIIHALASLDFPGEEGVHATCMSWVGINRIVVGYTDGTIALWSVFPQLVLLRFPTHMSAIQDIRSGYPSKPYLVSVRPVEGVLRLLDLTRPSSEHTFHPSPVAGIQGNMLDWVELMQGFATSAPANSPVSYKLDFLHHRHFPCPRKFFPSRRESPPTCLAVGKTHPFVLVGAADGKVWACNILDTVFPTHWESHVPSSTLIFASDFKRPTRQDPEASSLRGGTLFRFMFKQETESKADILEDDAADPDDLSGLGPSALPGQEALGPVIHEKLASVTALAWNPDFAFGTYFAIGLASGLVVIRQLDGTV